MFTTVTSVTVGVLFGLALAAPPGPMNAVIAEESVLRGWTAGFTAGVGAMVADGLFLILVLLGVATVLEGAVRDALFLAGGGLMLFFAVGAFREASAASTYTGDLEGVSTGFRKAFALSVTNPYQIGFWLTVGVGLVRPGRLDVFAHLPGVGAALEGTLVVQTGSPALLVGFFAGIVLWIVLYPAALVLADRRVDAFAPLVAAGSGFVLAGFGLWFLWVGASAFV